MARDHFLSVRPVWARCVAQELKSRGADVETALAECGLNWPLLNKADGWIPYVHHARFLEVAAREFRNDIYGMELAQQVDVRDGDTLAYLGIASATLGAALANVAKYSRVLSEAFQLELVLDGDSSVLKVTPHQSSLAEYRQATEFGMCFVIQCCRHFTGQKISPLEVRFSHQRRSDLAKFAEFFGCPVKFGQLGGRMTFSKKALAAPLVNADHRLLLILQNHAEEILRHRPRQPNELIHRIEQRLLELLPSGEGRAKVVAAEFGISERSLGRRLAELNTSFADIIERLRRDLARRYLPEQDLSLAQVAFLLGYSNQSAFSTACRRWTGKTPRELRSVQGSTLSA